MYHKIKYLSGGNYLHIKTFIVSIEDCVGGSASNSTSIFLVNYWFTKYYDYSKVYGKEICFCKGKERTNKCVCRTSREHGECRGHAAAGGGAGAGGQAMRHLRGQGEVHHDPPLQVFSASWYPPLCDPPLQVSSVS
jgi:hypothetical protein